MKIKNRCFLPMAIFGLLAMVLVACTSDSEDSTPSFKVTYNATENGSVTATVDGKDFTSGGSVEEGKTVIFTATPDAGYKVASWSGAVQDAAEPNRASLVVKKDAEVSVTFMAKTDTAYKIEHHKQNISDDNYTLIAADTESKTGATGEKTQAVAKSYEGFTAKEVSQETIAADGSTVVKIYYDRNTITLTFKAAGGKWADGTTSDKTVSGRFEASVSIPEDPVKTGYTFVGWATSSQSVNLAPLPSSFPVRNIEYTSVWASNSVSPISAQAPSYTSPEGLLSASALRSVSVAFSAAEGYGSYEWYVDKIKQDETSRVFVFFERGVFFWNAHCNACCRRQVFFFRAG